MKLIASTIVLVLIPLFTGCVARTYGLNEGQQKIAEEKYAQSPGLNLVEGEPFWNTAKVLARCILAPITLGISEGALRDAREYPYQKYSKELREAAIHDASKKYPNYHDVIDIFFAYCDVNTSYYRAFYDTAKELGYNDTQREYYELMYISGTRVVQKMVENEYRQSSNYQSALTFNAIEYCASKSDKVKKTLNSIKNELSYQKQALALTSQSSYGSYSSSTLDYDNSFRSSNSYGQLDLNLNSYGLGTHSDQFGRPARFEVIGQPNADTSLLQVQPNAYGLGVHSDQFGRPVQTTTGW